ncbi:MAG: DNA-3-methyladenine glycosylase I [Spirochaetaceae bacterium]|jgi:DNA-3-methyladenine glycosylase I|nr:DNA-3-methyladenine glycosylase I [Spirochaetaceae bacterium]
MSEKKLRSEIFPKPQTPNPKPLLQRCEWCEGDEEYARYHDEEWGVPLRDSQKLFEFLILDGAQAGLSWITILKRREAYRAAFDKFDAEKIVRYTDKDFERLIGNAGIIRNKLKIISVVKNARAYLEFAEKGASFSDWLWDFVDGKPIINKYKTLKEIPASTPLSEQISKELKKRGFTFVGPVIIYAFMQAAGLMNDHITSCFRYHEVMEL